MLSIIAEISRAILTPLIAIMAVYIGYQQWRTNRDKLRLELFERRLQVYETTSSILVAMYLKCEISSTELASFLKATNKSQFLFDKDVNDYLAERTTMAMKLAAISITSSENVVATEAQKTSAMEKKPSPSLSTLNQEQYKLEELFAPYLHFKK